MCLHWLPPSIYLLWVSGKLWATLPLKEQRGFVGEGGPGLLTRIPVKALGHGESVSPGKLEEAEQ